ncbi:DNA repair exonuclease [Bacillus sp. Cr_A10]|uniref:metallophosphoesterase family protein n=1 Tax=Bacillus sp. Cr_A10 TaxID=3033993 RepID=UPI0023DA8D00|nr:DNA repair exonuclease [Bacillus sp. Cr_A10]MDF2065223.1 DNA repair exonuclease [Bacillus sp. Cr_A10]
MTGVRFLHIADLHLDSPFKGLTSIPQNKLQDIRESTFKAFTNIINYAKASKPDFILIVGDIYDGENRSLRAQHLFQKGMEELSSVGIPVFICYGNHDHLSGNWVRFQLPDNVDVFGEEVDTKTLEVEGNKVHISGFSYKERHIRDAMHVHYPIANGLDFHIGMLHGSIEGNEEHDVYAPFRQADLISKGYDYWALGHIHKRQILSDDPPIVYPGNTQSRHRNEKGLKGFYEVSLTKGQANLQFIHSSAFIYDEVAVSCDGIIHANELIALIEVTLRDYIESNGSAIVDVMLTDITEDTEELLQSSTNEEWLQIIQESIRGEENFIVVQKLRIQMPKEIWSESSAIVQSIEQWNNADWKYALKELYQHPKGSRYLETISSEFVKETINEVEQLLSNVLAKRSE